MFDQRLQRYNIGQPKTHGADNSQQEQRRENARKITLAYKDKRKQAEQENDTSARLAEESDDKKGCADPGDGNSENRVSQPASPEPYCNQCRSRHPNTKLVSIFQQADRTEPDVSRGTRPAIRLIAIQMGIDLWPGERSRSDKRERRPFPPGRRLWRPF